MLTLLAVSAAVLCILTVLAPAVLIQLWLSRDVNPLEKREVAPISRQWPLASSS